MQHVDPWDSGWVARSLLDHEPWRQALSPSWPAPGSQPLCAPRQALGKYLLSGLGGHGNGVPGPSISQGDLLVFVARMPAMLGRSFWPHAGLGAAPSFQGSLGTPEDAQADMPQREGFCC